MPANGLEVTVRTLHILFGIFWVGAILFQHVLNATFSRLPPQIAGPTRLALGKRGIPAGLAAGGLTIVFGIWNQYIVYGKLAFSGTTSQVALGVALIATLAMIGLGAGVQLPAFRQLEAMAPKGPPPPLPPGASPPPPPPALVALQARMQMVLMSATLLALTAVVAMVVATLARTQGW